MAKPEASSHEVMSAPAKGEVRPGYKHTKLGWIPEEWEVEHLGNIIEIRNGQVDPKDPDFNQMTLVAPNHIESGTGRLREKVTALEQDAISGKYYVESGQVIYSKIRPYLRKAVLADEDCLCSADAYPISGKEQLDNRFLLLTALSERFTYYAVSASGRTGIPKVNREDLSDFIVALPPLTEQRRIAAMLGAWDRAIATAQHLLAAQQERKRGLMQELLTGRRRFKGFGGKWKEVRLSSVVSKAKGSVVTSNEDPTGTPVIDAGSYEGGATLYSTDTNALRCIDTDVLLLWDGSKAGRAMTGKRGIVGSTFVLLKPKEQIDPGFLTARLTLDEYKIMAIREGSGIPHVPKDFLHWYKFALPPLDEQRAIVGLLNSLDKEAASLKEQLDHLTTQKRGLMQQLLTGAVRVKH